MTSEADRTQVPTTYACINGGVSCATSPGDGRRRGFSPPDQIATLDQSPNKLFVKRGIGCNATSPTSSIPSNVPTGTRSVNFTFGAQRGAGQGRFELQGQGQGHPIFRYHPTRDEVVTMEPYLLEHVSYGAEPLDLRIRTSAQTSEVPRRRTEEDFSPIEASPAKGQFER